MLRQQNTGAESALLLALLENAHSLNALDSAQFSTTLAKSAFQAKLILI
jgi:hypothetical protein